MQFHSFYRKSDRKNPICAGIYFEISSRAILTSAKCVDDYVEDDLSVGFSRHNGDLSVRELIVHDDYNRGNSISIFSSVRKDTKTPR